MPSINASSFLLVKDTTAIGHSKSTIITLDLNLTEITNKESLGFQEYLPLLRSGKIKCEGLTAYDDSLNFEQFADYIITKSKQVFYFKELSNPQLVYRAEGYVNNVNEVGDYEEITEFDLEITLTDAITVTDPTEGLTWENVFAQWQTISDQWENV
jgi:hypothetical protein